MSRTSLDQTDWLGSKLDLRSVIGNFLNGVRLSQHRERICTWVHQAHEHLCQ